MSVPGLRLSFNLAVADIGFNTVRGREGKDGKLGVRFSMGVLCTLRMQKGIM